MSLQQYRHGQQRLGRQRPSMTMQGGDQGRGMLQHNGFGVHGGMNARGSAPQPAARAAAPAPAQPAAAAGARPDFWHAKPGFFQYGHNQWGFINDRGMIDWSAKQPKAGQQVYGWNTILPNLRRRGIDIPEQARTPLPFADDLYAQQMAEQKYLLDMSLSEGRHNVDMLNFNLDTEKQEGTRKFQRDREQLTAQMGGAGLDQSGIASGSVGMQAQDFTSFLDNLVSEHEKKAAKERTGMAFARTKYDAAKAAQIGLAKDRWQLEHPGAALPQVRRGVYQQGGRWYNAMPGGATVSWSPPRRAGAN